MMSEVGFIPRERIHKIKMELGEGVVNCRRGKKYNQYIRTNHFYILVITHYFSFNFFPLENEMVVSMLYFLPDLLRFSISFPSICKQQGNYRKILINSLHRDRVILIISVENPIGFYEISIMGFIWFACPIKDTTQNIDIYQAPSMKIQCLTLVANEKHTIVKQTRMPLIVHPKCSYPSSFEVRWGLMTKYVSTGL